MKRVKKLSKLARTLTFTSLTPGEKARLLTGQDAHTSVYSKDPEYTPVSLLSLNHVSHVERFILTEEVRHNARANKLQQFPRFWTLQLSVVKIVFDCWSACQSPPKINLMRIIHADCLRLRIGICQFW